MRFMANGIGIEYDVTGPRTGIPIIFIHGFPFNRTMWQSQVDAVKNIFYCITYDVRGHGTSDIGDGQYTIEYFVDDLIALLDHIKVSRVIAVGLSMGGYIALRAIERHPDRFRGIVLCDTKSEPDNNEGKIRRAEQAKIVKIEGMKKFAETFLPGVLYEKTIQKSPDIVQHVRTMIEKTSPVSVAATLIALAARTDTTPSLFNIKVPTLILVGKHDVSTPPSAANAMKEKIPGAELHIIPHAAHLSNLENPDVFNDTLVGFLQRIKS